MTDEDVATSPLMKNLNTDALNASIESQCIGKETCNFTIPQKDVLSFAADDKFHGIVLYA